GRLVGGGPVVALSSGRRFADRVTAARLGAQRYLSKPVTAAAIVDAVQALWPPKRPVATVVAVDDDPVVLDTLRVLLASDDLDHFKRVNDTYGHQVGDVVLRRMAELMLGAGAACAGRWGGEEFAMLFASMGTDETYGRVQQLLDRFRDDRFDDRTGTALTLSF